MGAKIVKEIKKSLRFYEIESEIFLLCYTFFYV